MIFPCSLEESSDGESIRKATWNTALNQCRHSSGSPDDTLTKLRTTTKTTSALQNLVIFRFDGEVNMFFTPLFLDALQR